MDEVEVAAAGDAFEQRVSFIVLDLVPAHVGQAQVAHLHQPDPARYYAEAVDQALTRLFIATHGLLGGLCQHLHAEAEAQQRLAGGADQRYQVALVEVAHGGDCGADPGQDQLVGPLDIGRVAAHQRRDAEALERHPDRGQVGAAGVDDHQFLIAHRVRLPMDVCELGTIKASSVITRFWLAITAPPCWRAARSLPPGWPGAGRGRSP
ncbi:hypothetical protein D3C80_1509050 [compost metagenome]